MLYHHSFAAALTDARVADLRSTTRGHDSGVSAARRNRRRVRALLLGLSATPPAPASTHERVGRTRQRPSGEDVGHEVLAGVHEREAPWRGCRGRGRRGRAGRRPRRTAAASTGMRRAATASRRPG